MTTYKHQSGWRFDFWKNGIRHRQAGFPTKEKARIAEAEARKKIKKTNTDFIRYCESRLDDLNERRTPKYANENEKLLKKLILKWGSKKEITRQDVEEYIKSVMREAELKHRVRIETKKRKKIYVSKAEEENIPAYVANKELRMIKALFNHAVEREMLDMNPAQKIKYFAVVKTKKYIPSKADLEKVLSQVNEEQKNYLQLIINTLGRVGEINNLKWEDIYEDYLILRSRKSKNSNLTERPIPLNKVLRKILKDKKEGFVFKNVENEGKAYLYRSKFLKTACERAGVKRFTFHALRHYGASTLANAGVAIPTLQELLGHAKSTTTDIYLQAIKGSLKDAVEKLTH